MLKTRLSQSVVVILAMGFSGALSAEPREPVENRISVPVERLSSPNYQQPEPAAVDYQANTENGGSSSAGDDSTLWELYNQLEQLQQEVARLRGQVEEQANTIQILKMQERERYKDLDRRINQLKDMALAAPQDLDENPDAGAGTGEATAAGAQESEAYLKAQNLIREKKLDQAKTAFQQFLKQYPEGDYAANAHYWLGAVLMVVQPPQLDQAKTHFEWVITETPDHSKVPATLYKLATLHDQQGNSAKAKELLNQVLNRFPGTKPAQLAKGYLDQLNSP